MSDSITERLLDWYSYHARKLPWRDSENPYAILVAEVMLQQTRVDTVLPYFARWMDRFPTIESLAAADQRDVLMCWEGLGYYTRARNLHQAAIAIVRDYDGKIPSDPIALHRLPGIGKAGAADIASIAFGVDIASVDGNIKRVVSRLLDLELPLGSQKFEQAIQQFVDQHLPSGRAGDFNQAWMDLGSAICLPKSPGCDHCPLNSHCLAYQASDPSRRPVRPVKQSIPEITVTAGILRSADGDEVLLALRPQNGLLGGLWEYPGGKLEENETLEDCLKREWQEELGVDIQVGPILGVYRHAYSHYKVILHAYFCQVITGTLRALAVEEFSWAHIDVLDSYPMGKIDRMISREIQRIHKN